VGRFYLDANALMRWAEGQATSPTPEQTAAATRVAEIIDDNKNTVWISELTFIEFHDQVLRYRASAKLEWTDGWVTSVQTSLMRWIESGRVNVQPHTPKSIEVAMSYISMARELGRSLKAADAIHLDRAIEWAHDVRETVVLVTGDRAFANFLDVIPSATRFVTIEQIVVTQPPEPGTSLSEA
jgi:predicted nucleic acid-binding protein